MDDMYWNSTLRNYPVCDHFDDASSDVENELCSVHNTGLVALSLECNDISDRGVELLARVLRKNQWLLGMVAIFLMISCSLT